MVSCRVRPCHRCFIFIILSRRFQEASLFLKKRATLEDEYGRGLQKLAKQTSEVYALNDGKAGYILVSVFPGCLLSPRTERMSAHGTQP